MKLFHLLPLLALAVNFSGSPAPAKIKATAAIQVGESFEVKDAEENNMLPWIASRKLVWDDFKSEPKKEGDAVASTSTTLGLAYQVRNNELTFDISCKFSKEKSWGMLKTPYILAHEQAHFDITELHARKLYLALYNYIYNAETFKKDISTIYERIVGEKEAMQEAYDSETDHSRKRRIQYEWLEKIDNLLADTEIFANYP